MLIMMLVGEAGDRRVRARCGIPWGAPRWPFELAPVHSRGLQNRLDGATCKRHTNDDDFIRSPCCKKQIAYGQGAARLNDAECQTRLKLWLLAGFSEIMHDSHIARRGHVAVKARHMDEGVTDAELDRRLGAMP